MERLLMDYSRAGFCAGIVAEKWDDSISGFFPESRLWKTDVPVSTPFLNYLIQLDPSKPM